ncbi:MAG: formate dehydrogenase [Actinobacteria bacterium]|nr:MAG: formate dehydrogenase [Actinomycetota bacterium]
MTIVYVPGDSAARSIGADEVAALITAHAAKAGIDIELRRNGSRGALWLETLVEVDNGDGRFAYGPVTPADVDSLFANNFLNAGAHPLFLGKTESIEWLATQDRVTFTRVGIIEPLSLSQYEAHGGLAGLRTALAHTDVVGEVLASGLRGRGGAGFPAGIKWRTVLEAAGDQKYVVCNADEGDSGTFADRMLMEGDPFTLIEGMAIAGIAVGATYGYIYIRSEYPSAIETMNKAIAVGRLAGVLGKSVLGSDKSFDLEVRAGAGSYVCGEETAMLESLEGKRGMVRPKPPLPAISGLFGKPTVINNVLTLASVPAIMKDGSKSYQDRGIDRSRGTQVFQLAGNIARGGIVETGFGISLSEMITRFGGGTLTGHPVKAVQVGGPLGAYLSADQLDVALDYESLAAAGAMLGHGGIVVFDQSVNMLQQARFAMEFCAEESCGKCTPCRIGAVRGVEVIDRIIAGEEREKNLELLNDLCDLMTEGSLCAMGGLTPLPVRSALVHFPLEEVVK